MMRTRVLLISILVVFFRTGSAFPQVGNAPAPQPGAGGAPGAVMPGLPLPPLPPGGLNSLRGDPQPTPVGSAGVRGRVVSAETGQPLRRAAVRATASEVRVMRATTTGADGTYEFKDLPAGRYHVTASKGGYVTLSFGQTRAFAGGRQLALADKQVMEKVDMRLPRGGVITGRVLDEFGEPVSDAMVMPLRPQFVQGRRRVLPAGQSAMTNDVGEFRLFGLSPGAYLLSATNRALNMSADVADDGTAYAPTFYPGTGDATQAQRVAVTAGQSVNDIVIPLMVARAAKISGTVLDGEGRRQTMGMVMAQARGLVIGVAPPMGQIKPDGTFVIAGVMPGEYRVNAMVPSAGPFGFPSTATVVVDGGDVAGVELIPQAPQTVTGRVVTASGNAASIRPSSVQIAFVPINPEDVGLGTIVPPQPLREDLTFEAKMAPGKMAVRVSVLDSSWSLHAVRFQGDDVTDTGIEVRAGADLSGLEVELTNRHQEVGGVVVNGRNERVSDYTAVVFARDPARWEGFSRYVAVGRADQDGRFTITTLPPGDYYVAAVEHVEMGQWSDPEYLESLRMDAKEMSLAPGDRKSIDLRLTEVR